MTFDFRSDTVTRPTPAMRQAMAQAEVGDDVYGEDPTVNRLEQMTAERLGLEAGLFVASGTQANLLGLMAHCERGDEYIVGQVAHNYKYEAGGAAVLGSIQPQPLDFNADGEIDLIKAKQVIKPDDNHFASTRLFCLENTNNGIALAMQYLAEAKRFVQANGLAFHLDGARVFNAARFHGVEVSSITAQFDTAACCFSKGLGAPVGSVLCGGRETIRTARRLRKMVGGGMRQAGILAAGAIHALEHHIERLQEDHENAKWIAAELAQIDELQVRFHPHQTNMIFMCAASHRLAGLPEFLRQRDIVIGGAETNGTTRLVTHLDVNQDAAQKLVTGIADFIRAEQPLKIAAASAGVS